MRIVGTLVALGVWMTPVMVTVAEQPSWAQSRQPSAQEIRAAIEPLMDQGIQLQQQGKPQQALEVWRQVLSISQQLKIKPIEAISWLFIGSNSHDMGKFQTALEVYQQALLIFREVKDREGEATTLNNLGFVYDNIGEPQQAIKYYQQALSILREMQDRQGEAMSLNNLGGVYQGIGEPQRAIEYYQQALPILRDVQDRRGEGRTLNNLGLVYDNIGEHQQAIEYYQQALPILRDVQDRRGEGTTLNNLGLVYDNIGEPQRAIEYYQQALPIVREVQDRGGEATVLNGLGLVYSNIGEPQRAIEYYQQALPIVRDAQDRGREAMTLTNLGAVYDNIGEPQRAIEYYQQALPIRQEVQDRGGEATTLNNLGAAYTKIGEPQQAIEYYQQALPIYREVQDRGGEATTLTNLGAAYANIGEPQRAIEYYQQALPIRREVQDRRGEAWTLNNLGVVYESIGERQRAIEYYEQALPIHREAQDRGGEAMTLTNLGAAYANIGEPQRAIEYYQQALPISQEVQDRRVEAETLNNLGSTYQGIGELQRAIEYFQQVLPIRRELQDRVGEATTLNNWGGVYANIGEPQQAIEYFQQALLISQAVQHRGTEAATLSNIAAVYRDTDQPEKAIEYWKESLEITLSFRSNLKQENRKTFIATNQGPAIALTSLLIQQNQPKEAFTWINRVTTYELADYTRLLGAKVENPEAQELIDEYNQRWQQIESLRRQLQLDSSDELSRRISTLETENIKLGEEIAQQFPEVADIFETTPTDIEQLQATIPAGTLVLQPVPLANVTNVPNTLALFLLTRDSFQVVQTSLDVEQFNQLLDQYLEQLQDRSDTTYTETSAELYNILIRPIESQINAYQPQHLSIIATGQLRYLPFETLYDEEGDQQLIEKYPINYLTRLSKTPPNRQPSAKSNAILAFGNPVPHPPQHLPGAEAEVNTITQLFANSQAYLNHGATLEQFKTQAPKFAFLHLATHGCFQKDGCKKLDMAANTILFADTTWPITDAALLGLNHTRLIALSACQTAREADVEGNLISGVAYLFERAGAQAVMASLWNVADESTQRLMSDFYQYVQEGMTQGEALRKAKLNQINRHPFFWSPFILIGDPR
ncbi:CHAT domain-containing protein [Roseofilum sp. SID3]|uniref:CHAT domain-containing protein n=1 Tax=Roseofilum sp. SID3 TaxID=2821499 RepID=UPI00298E8CDB|nr:tetratricopeptide repeat protein [Roseofilum sp. SID3]